MFEDVSRRLRFDKPVKHKLKFLILHHLRPNQYDGSWTDSAVRRFGRELEAHLQDLLDLSRADITSARPGKRAAGLRQISDLSERIVAYHERQDERFAEAAHELSQRYGKPILTATELAVADPDNAGPRAVRATGRLCYASGNRAVTALGHLWQYAQFRERRGLGSEGAR